MDIYRRAATGMTDKQAIALVTDDVGADSLPYPPADMWEVLKAWLAHFFPGTYRRTAQGAGLCAWKADHRLTPPVSTAVPQL